MHSKYYFETSLSKSLFASSWERVFAITCPFGRWPSTCRSIFNGGQKNLGRNEKTLPVIVTLYPSPPYNAVTPNGLISTHYAQNSTLLVVKSTASVGRFASFSGDFISEWSKFIVTPINQIKDTIRTWEKVTRYSVKAASFIPNEGTTRVFFSFLCFAFENFYWFSLASSNWVLNWALYLDIM